MLFGLPDVLGQGQQPGPLGGGEVSVGKRLTTRKVIPSPSTNSRSQSINKLPQGPSSHFTTSSLVPPSRPTLYPQLIPSPTLPVSISRVV